MKNQISTVAGALIILIVASVVGASVLLSNQEIEEAVLFEGNIRHEREEIITEFYGVSLPIIGGEIYYSGTSDPEKSYYDSTIGATLKDARGEEFKFSLDKRPGYAREEVDYYKQYFYIGRDHPGKEGAVKILYDSDEEKELLKILESWDLSVWQPKDQLDNTKAYALMFMRELKGELFLSYRGDGLKEVKKGEINRVYQNKELGFEFKFPENWFIGKCEKFDGGSFEEIEMADCVSITDPVIVMASAMELGGPGFMSNFSIEIEKPTNYGVKDLAEFIDLLTNDDADRIVSSASQLGKTKLSGEDVYIVSPIGHAGAEGLHIVFERDGYLYKIIVGESYDGFWVGSGGGFQFELEEEFVLKYPEIVGKMLSTFRFLD